MYPIWYDAIRNINNSNILKVFRLRLHSGRGHVVGWHFQSPALNKKKKSAMILDLNINLNMEYNSNLSFFWRFSIIFRWEEVKGFLLGTLPSEWLGLFFSQKSQNIWNSLKLEEEKNEYGKRKSVKKERKRVEGKHVGLW